MVVFAFHASGFYMVLLLRHECTLNETNRSNLPEA